MIRGLRHVRLVCKYSDTRTKNAEQTSQKAHLGVDKCENGGGRLGRRVHVLEQRLAGATVLLLAQHAQSALNVVRGHGLTDIGVRRRKVTGRNMEKRERAKRVR